MGLLYKMKGDYSKALEYFQSGLDIKRKTKATDKALVLSMNNVAITLSDLGKHDEGIEMLRQAFDIVDKYPGFLSDLHTCLLEEKLRLAQAYVGQKKYEEAQNNLIETLKDKEYFIKQMQQNVFVYESYKTLMEVSKHLNDQTGMESYFTYCKVELYRLTNFFEDLGNLTKSKEMTENLKSVKKMYRDFIRGRRG